MAFFDFLKKYQNNINNGKESLALQPIRISGMDVSKKKLKLLCISHLDCDTTHFKSTESCSTRRRNSIGVFYSLQKSLRKTYWKETQFQCVVFALSNHNDIRQRWILIFLLHFIWISLNFVGNGMISCVTCFSSSRCNLASRIAKNDDVQWETSRFLLRTFKT